MNNPTKEPGRLCIALLCFAGLTTISLTVLTTPWLAEPLAHEGLDSDKPKQNVQQVAKQHVPEVAEQDAPYVVEQDAQQALGQHPASSNDEIERFNPEDFVLSDLVENLDDGNHFEIPAKAQPFFREVLASGPDVNFGTHDQKGTYAYISSDLSPNIWINLSYPAERTGEAICHELLHFQDFKRFKPITGFRSTGLAADQSKLFQPVLKDLVNMISHEYVQENLEQFGYAEPLSDNADARMKHMASGLATTEEALVSVSKQLTKNPNKKVTLNMAGLQAVYQNLLLMTLRDQLLFDGTYASDVDKMIVRFQAVLDFIHQSTSEDSRFKKVYVEVQEPARSIRDSCKQYQRSNGSTEERYALLRDTLDHIYDHVGISFELIQKPSEAPILKATSASFQPGESFLLDGDFVFSNVSLFTPGSVREKALQLNYRTYRHRDLVLPQESLARVGPL